MDVLPNAQCTQFHGKWAEKDRNFGVTLMIEPVFMRATREGVKIIVVKIAPVVSMTPLYLAVVPRRSGWNQLVLHTGVLQSNVKRTEFHIADLLVCKLRPVIRLDCLNLERKYFLKHFEELYRVFRCMLLKPVNKSYSGAFVYGCPLVKVLSVPSCCAFQAVIVLFSLRLDAYMLLVLFCS